jgi:uncharacterized OsmC-like protein
MTTGQVAVDNGVDIGALRDARTALGETPALAQFEWRSSVKWVSGTHSRSEVESFYGLNDEQVHHTSFSFDADHPMQFAATDVGITPIEYVLVALGSCLTGGIATIAQQRDIQLRSVRATLSAHQDLQGILGIDPDVRNGFTGVTVNYEIDADCSPAAIEALVAQSQKRSAVYDILTNPTNVTVSVC